MTSAAANYPGRVTAADRPNLANVAANAVWVTQDMIMATREEIDDIAEAVAKVYRAFNG